MATVSDTEDSSCRLKSYKNKGSNLEEGRRKRHEEVIILRKSKREDQFLKKRNISVYGDEDKIEIWSVEVLHKSLYSKSEEEIITAISRFRKLLSSEKLPPIEETIGCGCLPRFTEFLTSSNNQLQFESSWIITNIASGSSLHTRAVVDAGAIVPLIQLILHSENIISDQALWALGNIAGDGPEFRDLLLNHGIMVPLLNILATDIRQKKNATWTLSNLCRGKDPLPNSDLIMPCVPYLAKLLFDEDKEILSNSLWSVAFLADGPNDRIQKVVDSGICLRLSQILLLSAEKELIAPALRAVGNILTGNDYQTQIMINSSVLPALNHLLTSSQDNLQKEACWAISNITAGNRVQIQATIDCNTFPSLIDIMCSGVDYKTRKEAAWAILNATSGGTQEQVRYLVSIGCIKPLCDLLTVQDSRLVVVTLEGLENILKVGNKYSVQGLNPFGKKIEEAYGVDKIEYLQAHVSDRIYQLAGRIIEKYFTLDDLN